MAKKKQPKKAGARARRQEAAPTAAARKGRTNPSEPDDRQTAYHEAGHFVVGVALRPDEEYTADTVSIERRDNALGYNDGEFPNGHFKEHIVELYAGFEAQVRFAPECAEIARGNSADDDVKAALLLGKLFGAKGSPPVMKECEALLRRAAAEVVAEQWTAIGALAKELLLRRKFDGNEARYIVDAANGDPAAAAALAYYRAVKYGRPGMPGAGVDRDAP